MSHYCLEVVRNNLEQHRIVALPPPDSLQLQDREAVIRVDRFGLTANNITYGVAGDLIGYWRFFPAAGDHGRVPAWGMGTVINAGATGLAEGDEYYGYFPMASYLVVKPGPASPGGFTDEAEHRAPLPPTYNRYALVTEANGFNRAHDNHRMVYYPLFATGFVLDDYLSENDFFGADQVIVSSASSKTAFSLALLLHENRDCRLVGLTSSGNRAFVSGMGIYDQVVGYDDIAAMDRNAKVAFVDMAGNRKVLETLHHHFGEGVVCSCGVGITHRAARDGQAPAALPGAKPAMFFAPDRIRKRTQEWGPEKFQAEMQQAWAAFLARVDGWVSINERSGRNAMVETWEEVLRGAPPDQAFVIRV